MTTDNSETKRTPHLDQHPIIHDPHVVYTDAVLNSPWNESGGSALPSRDDWSTYRCASKDIIVGVVTHRYNRQTRQLDVRAYFVGEHPVFKDMEPTRILMIVLCSQAYQAGGSMAINFEQGIPFDVRYLIEERLQRALSGHDTVIEDTLAQELYASLSNFSPQEQELMGQDSVPVELVCFNTYRGTWSSRLIKLLLKRGIPLRWIFKSRLNPIGQPAVFAHLINHLRAALMEEYGLHRLGERKLGSSAGLRIEPYSIQNISCYICDQALKILGSQASSGFENDSFVDLVPDQPFILLPTITHSADSLMKVLDKTLRCIEDAPLPCTPVMLLPLDFVYVPSTIRQRYLSEIHTAGCMILIIGLTASQLIAEAEFNLAVTASQLDDEEVEVRNANRYAD